MTDNELTLFIAELVARTQRKMGEFDLQVWWEEIGEYPVADAKAAARTLIRAGEYVSPDGVRRQIKTVRSQRLTQVRDAELTAGIDPSDPLYLMKKRARVRAIADGVPVTQAISSPMRQELTS